MGNNRNFFALDDAFWENYLKRRPRVADSFFDRIFNYHRASFGAVHDTGAGNGPYAQRLRSRFYHVIVSDIMAENAELARHRLQGAKGFSFRTSPLKEADDIEAGSVDMIFATNATHFPESQDTAMDAVARQLRPGGTFTAAGFAPVRFHDAQLQDLWDRISREGGQQLLSRANNPRETIRFMLRTQGRYNVAPLPQGTSTPGALRIHLNMREGGIRTMLPIEESCQATSMESNHTGPDDAEIFEDEERWSFEMNLAGVKENFMSFPFVSEFPSAFTELYRELDNLFADGKHHGVQGHFPVKIILATRC